MSGQAKTFTEWWMREGLALCCSGKRFDFVQFKRVKYLCAVAFVAGEIAALQVAKKQMDGGAKI